MKLLTVKHTTVYRYAEPVSFGDHRLMFRPRDSHDLRLLRTDLVISPFAQVRWLHDVFSNSVAIAHFEGTASELRLESTIDIEHYGIDGTSFAIEPYAETYPFSYSANEAPDLLRLVVRHHADPDHLIDLWARKFLRQDGPTRTRDLLVNMTLAIRSELTYRPREGEGTQEPVVTLSTRTGTCRDYALLMMEACRSLGLAARFVSGYLYDPALDGADDGTTGGGSTHAWVEPPPVVPSSAPSRAGS